MRAPLLLMVSDNPSLPRVLLNGIPSPIPLPTPSAPSLPVLPGTLNPPRLDNDNDNDNTAAAVTSTFLDGQCPPLPFAH